MRRRRSVLLAAAAALLVLAPLQAAAASATHSSSPVFAVPPPLPPAQVGGSSLVRTDAGVSAALHTTGLTPGDAVTLWWVVFNNPEACENPFATSPCGPPDVPNADAQGSVVHAGGRIVGQEGAAGFGAHLRVGDDSRALVGPGLLDARDALVVLVVKTHGPKIPGLTGEMLHTFAAGCADQTAPPGARADLLGTPGTNDCAEIQLSVHLP
jgi:hypothetical protein